MFTNEDQFQFEADVWYANADTPGSIGNLLAQNITVPGLSMLFPNVHCLADGSVCQVTTGEAEINAASSISALIHSPKFDLTKTYFLIAGIAGINPQQGTTGDVCLSKYSVQVGLQFEIDARQIPANFSTGYFPQGSDSPDEYPQTIYGTEVFELNEALRNMAVSFASSATLNDSETAIEFRKNFANVSMFEAATKSPSIITCDVAIADQFWSGSLLGDAFSNVTRLFTNGSAVYCMTAQEDNATLEAMVRGAITKLVDFSRVILMRTASDFDRAPPGISELDELIFVDTGGFDPAIENIYLAGTPVVQGILAGWKTTFKHGIDPTNYIGDIFGSLGGVPDFGPGSIFMDMPVNLADVGLSKRSVYKRGKAMRKGAMRAEVVRRASGNVA
jgi:purine nucleoside permease